MNLEIILGFVVWFVISEIIFIILTIKDFMSNWITTKFTSFFFGGIFMCIQLFILTEGTHSNIIHYEYLLYELIVLAGIGLLFLLNYKLYKFINKNEKGK